MSDSNIQPTQSNLTDLTPYNVDGLELYFTTNRKVKAHLRALSRMCEVSTSSLQNFIAQHNTKSCDHKINVAQVQVQVGKQIRTVHIYDSVAIAICMAKYNPDRLVQFTAFGIDEGLAQMAGVPIQSTPAPQQPLTAFEYASLYVEAEKGRLALAAQIEADKFATDLGKLIDKAEGNISMGEYAKAIGTGRQRLFNQLREQKIIMPFPLNTPYQKHLEAKRFVVTEKVTEQGHVFAVTLITPKGQTYLAKKHLEYQNREKITVMLEKELELV